MTRPVSLLNQSAGLSIKQGSSREQFLELLHNFVFLRTDGARTSRPSCCIACIVPLLLHSCPYSSSITHEEM